MEQKEIIQIIKDLRDCPKESTSKWHVDICANKLIDKLETKQLILSGVSTRELPPWVRPLITIITMSLVTVYVIYKTFYVF